MTTGVTSPLFCVFFGRFPLSYFVVVSHRIAINSRSLNTDFLSRARTSL